jgi:hypothetical protein
MYILVIRNIKQLVFDHILPIYSATDSSPDVVPALVEDGGASLDIRVCCGGTVIDWINDYVSIPKSSDIRFQGIERRLN